MKKQVKELSLQRAAALLEGKKLNEQTLLQLVERVKAFCKISYQLYLQKVRAVKNDETKKLDAEPPDEFTNA